LAILFSGTQHPFKDQISLFHIQWRKIVFPLPPVLFTFIFILIEVDQPVRTPVSPQIHLSEYLFRLEEKEEQAYKGFSFK
jgi:hypothetical protein